MDDESNIQLLCANCHEDKTAEDLKGQRPTPEQRQRISDTLKVHKKSEITKLKISLARLKKVAQDENFAASLRRMPGPISDVDRICNDCGLRTIPGAIGHHQKASGHSGYIEAPRDTSKHNARELGMKRGRKEVKYDRICNGCGRRTTPGPMSIHQRATGHTGYTEVPNVL